MDAQPIRCAPPRRKPAAALLALLLPACAASGFNWQDAPRVADPDPAGPPVLRAYKESFYRALGYRWVDHADRDTLLAHAMAARVLFIGDQHDDPAWHAEIEQMLDGLHRRGVRVVLGLEAIGSQDNRHVRGFAAGKFDLGELRMRMRQRWPESWLDNPEVDTGFFRRLLTTARERGQPLFPLEPTPRLPLEQRDAVIAASIRRAAARWPDALIVVVVGQAHLLGDGGLLQRTGLPAELVVGRMSTTLRRALQHYAAPRGPAFLRTDTGAWVRWRPLNGVIPRPGPSAIS